MFSIKADSSIPHHYIIGVAKENDVLVLKYEPVYFSYEDVKNIRDALLLADDKIYTEIYKMSQSEIYEMFGSGDLMMKFIAFKLMLQLKLATVHYFSYESKIPEPKNYFTSYVESANENKLDLEELNKAKIQL